MKNLKNTTSNFWRYLGLALPLLFFSCALTLHAVAAATPGLDTSYSYSFTDMRMMHLPGSQRYYIVHTPPNYNPRKSYPLIMFLHAGQSNALSVSKKDVNLSDYADQLANSGQQSFIVVYPQGYTSSAGGYWNAWNCDDGSGNGINGTNVTACTGDAYEAGSDDVSYLNTVLDNVQTQYSVDTKRVYAMGHSNGAGMTHRLGCELSDRIAAIAPIEGTTKMAPCTPTANSMPIIEFASLTDPNSVYCGGLADTSISYTLGALPGISQTCASNLAQVNLGTGVWQGINTCSKNMTQTNFVNLNPSSLDKQEVLPNYQVSSYLSCAVSGAVRLYTLQRAPHTWLYSFNTLVVDWRIEAWNFFKTKSR